MVGSDKDQSRSRRLGVEDRGSSSTSQVLGGWRIGRSGDAMCDSHHTHGGDKKRGFSGLASKSMVIVW
jgi:hypothetical protein